MFIFEALYSRLFLLRIFGLLKYLRELKLPIQLKIFIKSVMNFSSYVVPGFIIFVIFALVVNLIALDTISADHYISVLAESAKIDLYPFYMIASSQIFFSTGWSAVRSYQPLGDAPDYGGTFAFGFYIFHFAGSHRKVYSRKLLLVSFHLHLL